MLDQIYPIEEAWVPVIAKRMAAEYTRKTGDNRPWVHVGFSGHAPDFLWFICLGTSASTPYFRGSTLAEAAAEAEKWLNHNLVAEVNETLGLTRDGRLCDAPVEDW